MTVDEQTAFGFSGTMACVEIMGGRGDVPSYSEPEAHRVFRASLAINLEPPRGISLYGEP